MNPKFKVRKAKKSKSKKSGTAVLSAPMRSAIHKIVQADAPHKLISYQVPFSGVLQGSFISGAVNGFGTDSSSFMTLIPPVAQGTNINERIGDRVRPMSCVLNLVVSTNVGNPSQDAMLRVMMVTDRSIKGYAYASTASIAYGSLIDGGGSPRQYVGVPVDNLTPINSRQFVTHHDKLVHLQKSQGVTNNSNTTTVGNNVSAGSRTLHHFRLKVPLPKVLKYDQELDPYPSNAAPLLCIGFAQHDGGTIVPNTILYQGYVTMRFEDA